MNKMVEQAKRMLEENGVNPAMLDETIKYAKAIQALESELCVTVDKTSRYIKSLEIKNENLEEEICYLERAVDDYRNAGLRHVETDIEFLEKFINIDFNCQDGLQKLKDLQDVAGRRLIVLRDIELYSR